jgi:hypothetical protein
MVGLEKRFTQSVRSIYKSQSSFQKIENYLPVKLPAFLQCTHTLEGNTMKNISTILTSSTSENTTTLFLLNSSAMVR